MTFYTDHSGSAASPFLLGYRRLASSVASAGRGALKARWPGRPQSVTRPRSGPGGPDLMHLPQPDAPEASPAAIQSFPDLEVRYDAESGVYWQWMRPRERPSYTMELLDAMKRSLAQAQTLSQTDAGGVQYLVTGSRVPGIFNLGGDLPHFAQLIREGDRETLRAYAHACIDVQYGRATNMNRPYVSISLVQGDALGGGFECALADDVIIAERDAKFGLPEVLFGLFPGMGAYSFLSRKLGDAMAERMILSGKIYTADEMHEMGLVSMVAEPGEGEAAVAEFIHREQRTFRARTALSRIRQRIEPVTREELIDVTDTWVDTALTLGPSELRKMQRLASAQDRRWQQIRDGGDAVASAAE